MEARITELQEKCDEMMRLKFGRIIDLEKLETIGVNRTVEELKEKLKLNEFTNADELQKWEVSGRQEEEVASACGNRKILDASRFFPILRVS